MTLPAADFPGKIFTGNEQSTANDGPADTTLAQGLDYNKHSAEIIALQNRTWKYEKDRAVNRSGVTITALTVVAVTGFDASAASGAGLSKIELLDESIRAKAYGIVEAAIVNNAEGEVTIRGPVVNIDTSAGTVGGEVWYDPIANALNYGNQTNGIYVGRVLIVNASTGVVLFDFGHEIGHNTWEVQLVELNGTIAIERHVSYVTLGTAGIPRVGLASANSPSSMPANGLLLNGGVVGDMALMLIRGVYNTNSTDTGNDGVDDPVYVGDSGALSRFNQIITPGTLFAYDHPQRDGTRFVQRVGYTLSSSPTRWYLDYSNPLMYTWLYDYDKQDTVKRPIVAASTSDETGSITFNELTLTGITTIDGVTISVGDSVLLTAQSPINENGLWECISIGGGDLLFNRPEDYNHNDDADVGNIVPVKDGGTINANSVWILATGGNPADSQTWKRLDSSGTENDVINVSKVGNDNNPGTDRRYPKSTIAAALTAATALVPSSTNVITIRILDSGIYTENLTFVSWVNVLGPSAILTGTHIIVDDAVVHFHQYNGLAAAASFTKSAGTGRAHIKCKIGKAAAAGTLVSQLSGFLFFEADTVFSSGTHILGVDSGGTLYFNVNEAVLDSGGRFLNCIDGSFAVGRIGSINGPGDIGINVSNATATVSGIVGEIVDSTNPWKVDLAGVLNMVVGKFDGTPSVITGSIANVTIMGEPQDDSILDIPKDTVFALGGELADFAANFVRGHTQRIPTVTNGSPTIVSDIANYGGGAKALDFDVSTSDYLKYNLKNASGFPGILNDFAIRFKTQFTTLPSVGAAMYQSDFYNGTNNNNRFFLQVQADDEWNAQLFNGTGTGFAVTSVNNPVVVNRVYDVLYCTWNDNGRQYQELWVDGILVANRNDASWTDRTVDAIELWLATQQSGSTFHDGQIQDFQMKLGKGPWLSSDAVKQESGLEWPIAYQFRDSEVPEDMHFIWFGNLTRGRANYSRGPVATTVVNGAPTQVAAIAPYGAKAYDFDGTEHFFYGNAQDRIFPVGDNFTLKCFVKFDVLPSVVGASEFISSLYNGTNNNNRFDLSGESSADKIRVNLYDGIGGILQVNSVTTIVVGTLYEIKVVSYNEAGTQKVEFYIDGKLDASGNDGTWTTRTKQVMSFSIGAFPTGSQPINGQIQDMQIRKNVDRSLTRTYKQSSIWPILKYDVQQLGAPLNATASRHIHYVPDKKVRVQDIYLTVGTTTTSDATNHWTAQVRAVVAAVDLLSAAYDTNGGDLTADTPQPLGLDQNLELNQGENLRLDLTKINAGDDLTELAAMVAYQETGEDV